MEGLKETIKRAGKIVLGTIKKLLIPIVAVVCLIFILLSAAVYFLTVDDGTYKEDDWSSTPYAASVYVNSTRLNEDGSLSTSTTAEELWDKMLENGSRVDEYLDSPEELARLMKAEIVTQYPDMRSNPDDPIDWEEIINSDTIQGIIKFKRADTSGNVSTMTYVDPATFQGYIDEYNSTGSESARNEALSHFTLRKGTASTATGNGGAVAAGDGVMTDVSQAIIDAANRTPWPGAQWCARWVRQVYENAGLPSCGQSHPSAYDAAQHHIISTDMSAIPIGAAVYGTGSGSSGHFGHVGIYIGGGQVMDSQNSGIVVSSMEQWLSWQKDVINGQQGWLGWGWQDNNRTRGTTQDPNVTENKGSTESAEDDDEEDENGNVNRAVETSVSGDGYSLEYTSSAGITYKQFKQIRGSYANNPYWDGTIKSSGCGPTSVAILASGLTDLNYTPANTAQEMNDRHGMTSAEYLKEEMDSIGLTSEVTYNPTAEQIQDNLRNGKVMLVSVNSNTIFTSGGHIMALIDINDQGQVYISNPSSDSLNGWFDVSEIMKGCAYIVTTNAGAAGVASTTNTSDYVVQIASWNQVDTNVTTNDPNVEGYSETTYTMSTIDVNYQDMVEPYTMPFDYLWALLVVGEDKNFAFDIADLVYNSDIEITVHDNLTVNTDVDEWTYTQVTKSEVEATVTVTQGNASDTANIERHEHDPEPSRPEQNYTTTKTVVTQTNTVNVAVTRANVWIVDYQNNYTYVAPSSTTTTSTTTQEDQDYPSEPTSTETSSTYRCDEIEEALSELISSVGGSYSSSQASSNTTTIPSSSSATGSTMTTAAPMTTEVEANVDYYTKYVDIKDEITHTVETQKYTSGTPTLKEKTDPDSEEPNFVTIFNNKKYRTNKSNIKSASSWLFEILETNDSTKDVFVDLTKYLLYKATGVNYGVTEFDFSIFYPGNLTSVGADDYIVNIDMSSSDLVITDLATLQTAFSGYSGSSELIKHAQEFLDFQEEYRVNAVFAAAVSISETSAGRNGHAVDGKNNWFNIECTCGNSSHGRFESYSSASASIERFYWQISQGSYYFTEGNYTVRSIGMIYCEDADAPGGWIENTLTYMTQMYQAAGINVSPGGGSSQTGEAIVEAAKSKLGCPYVWGATGPNSFDCSGLTQWCYNQVGISIPRTTGAQKSGAKKVVPVSEARVGDILFKQGHVGIYIGNGQYIHAPKPGRSVETQSNVNYFECALQYY